MSLRFITYLAPSIPLELYRALAGYLEQRLGRAITLVSEQRLSGPTAQDDPFARDEVDVGFMCAPCYLTLARRQPCSVRLVGAAPLYDDPRANGHPVYFSEIVVRADSAYHHFSDLLGACWTYNDRLSLSGYISVLRRLAADSLDKSHLGTAICAGSHLAALDLVTQGAAAFAAVDSATLAHQQRHRPDLVSRLRVLESLGPHPVQPVVARTALSQLLVAELTDALLNAHCDPRINATINHFGLERFLPVTPENYTEASVFGLTTPPWAHLPAARIDG